MSDDLVMISDPQPTRADAVKNRTLLLETARRLFAEKGVEAVSMSAIAEAAGVGKGTLYRHFENKTALCAALLDDEQRDLQERTFQQLRLAQEPLEKLCWFLGEVLGFIERNEVLLSAEFRDGSLPTLLYPAHLWWRQTILGLLRQARITGDPEYTADILYVMLDPRTIYFQRFSLRYAFSRIEDGLHQTVARLTSG